MRLFNRVIREAGLGLKLVGVGGAGCAEDVREYLTAGAHSVHLATAAMVDPAVGRRLRRDLGGVI